MIPHCPLCGTQESVELHWSPLTVYGSWRNDAFVKSKKYLCTACNMAFVYPMPTKNELNTFYTNDYRSPLTISSGRGDVELPFELAWSEKSFLRVQNLTQILERNDLEIHPDEKHLDIGGYQGLFSWGVSRVYKSTPSISDYPSMGLDFARGVLQLDVLELEDVFLHANQEFALISLVQVLEHLPEPLEFLKDIRRTLIRRGGILYVEVPNIYQFPCTDPSHLYDFSQYALSRLMIESGFLPLDFLTHGHPDVDFLPNSLHTISAIATVNKSEPDKPQALDRIDPREFKRYLYTRHRKAEARIARTRIWELFWEMIKQAALLSLVAMTYLSARLSERLKRYMFECYRKLGNKYD